MTFKQDKSSDSVETSLNVKNSSQSGIHEAPERPVQPAQDRGDDPEEALVQEEMEEEDWIRIFRRGRRKRGRAHLQHALLRAQPQGYKFWGQPRPLLIYNFRCVTS